MSTGWKLDSSFAEFSHEHLPKQWPLQFSRLYNLCPINRLLDDLGLSCIVGQFEVGVCESTELPFTLL